MLNGTALGIFSSVNAASDIDATVFGPDGDAVAADNFISANADQYRCP